MAERGRWVRGFGYRYWEGPCPCGSGKDGWEVYDKMNIYAGIACPKCEKEFNAKFAPGILPGSDTPYSVDEPIDEDD